MKIIKLAVFVVLFSALVVVGLKVVNAQTIDSNQNTPACSTLWWFDSATQSCSSQRQFCGSYMYAGLQTFATQAACQAALPTHLTITSPNGGESWQTGETYGITWNSSGIDKVNISLLYFDNTVSPTAKIFDIATNISASAGKYSWTIPYSQIIGVRAPLAGTNFQVVISEVGGNVSGKSDKPFTIVAGKTCSEKCQSQGFENGVCRAHDLAPYEAYCEENGYTYETRTDSNGDENGFCVFPDGTECVALYFLNGTCGQQEPTNKEYDYLKYGCNAGEVKVNSSSENCEASDCYDVMEVSATCCCLPVQVASTSSPTPTVGIGGNGNSSSSIQALQQRLVQLLTLLLQLLQKAIAQGLLGSSQLSSIMNSISH